MIPNPTSRHGVAGCLPLPAWNAALRALLLALLCTASVTNAAAQDATGTGPDLRMNGFGTLGLVEATPHDDWGFRRDVSQPSRHDGGLRADVDSRLGLQAAWRLDPQWEFVGQLVLKPRADEAADDESLAWAFAAWRPTPEWTLRVGRTSPDLFLLSDVRNVGFVYPWMRPNVEFYGWVPVSALDGIDVARQWQLGEGYLRAKLFAGRTSVTLASTQGDGDTHANVRPLVGGTLTWDSGALTVKATLAQARSRARDPAAVGRAHAGLDGLAALPIPIVASQAGQLRDSFPADVFVTRYAALGLAWDASPWQLQAEVARISGNFDSSDSWYGYASAARRFGDTTLFATIGRARASHRPLPDPQWTTALTPVLGPALAAAAQELGQGIASNYNLAREDQASVGIGARLDLDDRIAVKLQLDAVRSAAFGGGLWSHDTLDAHHALVWSTGLDFVF
jgi:hypothetical protein